MPSRKQPRAPKALLRKRQGQSRKQQRAPKTQSGKQQTQCRAPSAQSRNQQRCCRVPKPCSRSKQTKQRCSLFSLSWPQHFFPSAFVLPYVAPYPHDSVCSDMDPYQYFGMNNIKEFNNNPISRREFWAITGPVCGGITLLAVMILSLSLEGVSRFMRSVGWELKARFYY